MIDQMQARAKAPWWLLAMAAFGVAWNGFGVVQLGDFVMRTQAGLMMNGMTAAASALYYNLPAWMTAVFAIGSVGGLVGSIALALRRRIAVPILAASLLGYIALFAGDHAYGVFAAIPGQMAVLSMVVAIAVLLLGTALTGHRKRLLQ